MTSKGMDSYRSYRSQTWLINWNAVSSKQRSCRYCYMDALYGCWLNGWRKSLMATTQECCEQYWTSPGGNTPQSSSCTATYLPSQKLSKLDEPDMQDTAGEAGMSSCDVLLWTPSHGRAKAGWPARTYIQQLCEDTGCSPEDLPEAMDDKEEWRERVRDIRAGGTTRWWWHSLSD